MDAFALHNAFELNYPDAMTGVVGLLNIGHEVTNINILEDGVPILTRDLAIGHAAVPRGSAAGARDVGRGRGQAAPGLRAERRARPVPGEPWRGDGGRHRAGGGVPPDGEPSASGISRIYTSGGGSRIPGLNRVLADRLRLPVELANPLENLRVRKASFDTLNVDEVAPLLMLPDRSRPAQRGLTPTPGTDCP